VETVSTFRKEAKGDPTAMMINSTQPCLGAGCQVFVIYCRYAEQRIVQTTTGLRSRPSAQNPPAERYLSERYPYQIQGLFTRRDDVRYRSLDTTPAQWVGKSATGSAEVK
jgi:hypothetical protein